MKMLKCNLCGQIITVEKDTKMPISCCGEIMEEIIPNKSDGATEKHVPVLKRKGNELEVCIGSAPHPMTDEHYIEWILVETSNRKSKIYLGPGDTPSICLALNDDEEVLNVYAYCNIHGLWVNKK